jgi:general secretion pathway protein F
MPVFEYKAINLKGRTVKGIITADGPSMARMRLSQDMVFPTEVREVREEEKKTSATPLLRNLPGFHKVSAFEVTAALRQLATLVGSAIPLVDCLGALIDQTEQPRLKKVFTQIREKVVEGSSLYQAMTAHPAVFNQIYVNMVRAGETGGALDVILRRLADFSERSMKLRKKIEAAMTYPMFLLMISTVILIFLMSFVMPKVIGIFKGMEVALPWSTRILIWSTHVAREFWWLIILILLAGYGLTSFWLKSEAGRKTWDGLRLHIPLFGRLHHHAVVARFTRTLSTLLKSGILLVDALEIARLSMGNRIMENVVREVIRLVGEGKDFAGPLKSTGRFPPLVVQLVRAGEQSGELEEMLAKAAEVYEDEVESAIASLTSLVEPAIILGMGAVVGFIVMAILLPIFDMTGGIR